jgi:ABC-2 type transport system permease protein
MAWYMFTVETMVAIGVAFFCAPAIASEFEERTALLMFPRPMKKTTFFIGKALACYIVCGGIIVLYYVISIFMTLINGGSVEMIGILSSLGIALLFMLGAGGFALMLSSILKKGSTAVIVTLATFFMILGMIDMMYNMFIGEPMFSITYAATNIIAVIDSTLADFVYGGSPTILMSVAIISAWAVITTTLAAILFRRREY